MSSSSPSNSPRSSPPPSPAAIMREYIPTTNSIFWIGARLDPMPKGAILSHGLTRSGGDTLTTVGNYQVADVGSFIPEDSDAEDVNFIPVDYTTRVVGTFSSNKFMNYTPIFYGETTETPLCLSDIISPAHDNFKLHYVETTGVCRIKAGDFVVAMGGNSNTGYLDKANLRAATIMLFQPSGFSMKTIRDMSDPTTLLAIRERIEDFCCSFKLLNRGNHELKVHSSSAKRDYQSEPQDAMGEVRFATRLTTSKKLLQESRDFFSRQPLDLSSLDLPGPKMTASEFAADQVRNKMNVHDDVVDMSADSPPSSPKGPRAGQKKGRDKGAVRPGGAADKASKRVRVEKVRYSPGP